MHTTTVHSTQRKAWNDISEGLRNARLWHQLAWFEVKQRYRRSTLGPLWLIVNMTLYTAILGVLYGMLFHVHISEFLPHVAIAYATWTFLSSCINDSTYAFIQNASIIQQIRLPFSIYIYRLVWKNLIVFLHSFLVVISIFIYFEKTSIQGVLLFIPMLACLVTAIIPIGFFLGIISARYRDIQPIIHNVLQIAFYVTPVLWRPEQIQDARAKIYILNPLFHFIEIIRRPLLFGELSYNSLGIVTSIMVVMMILAFSLFAKYRARIAYWV